MINGQNTMGKKKYVLEHIVWGFIALIWYLYLIFKRVKGCSLIVSLLILSMIVVISSLFFGWLDFRKKRNTLSIFFNLISGYGIYTVISYLEIRGGLIKTILVISSLASAVWLIYIMNRMPRKGNRKKIILRRVKNAVYSTGRIFGLGMAVIVIVQVIYGIRHSDRTNNISEVLKENVLYSDAVVYDRKAAEEQTIANNIETLALLEQSRWSGLSTQERLDVLQVVGNIERRYLGLPHELNVVAKDLEEGIGGNYEDASHQVTIDIDCLVQYGPEQALETILHECHHAYAYRCWEAYSEADDEIRSLRMFKKAKQYGFEFENYISANENRDEYLKQQCEIDAKEYAQEAKKDYMKKINDFYASGMSDTGLRQ